MFILQISFDKGETWKDVAEREDEDSLHAMMLAEKYHHTSLIEPYECHAQFQIIPKDG